MIKRDFHGYLLSDALLETQLIIGRVRNNGIPETAEFITGNGRIKIEVFETLKDHGLSPTVKLGNSGGIVVNIE